MKIARSAAAGAALMLLPVGCGSPESEPETFPAVEISMDEISQAYPDLPPAVHELEDAVGVMRAPTSLGSAVLARNGDEVVLLGAAHQMSDAAEAGCVDNIIAIDADPGPGVSPEIIDIDHAFADPQPQNSTAEPDRLVAFPGPISQTLLERAETLTIASEDLSVGDPLFLMGMQPAEAGILRDPVAAVNNPDATAPAIFAGHALYEQNGKLSVLLGNERYGALQDATLRQGSSGGLVVTAEGKLVGTISSYVDDADFLDEYLQAANITVHGDHDSKLIFVDRVSLESVADVTQTPPIPAC